MDDEKCRELFSARYDGTYTFAFDDVRDAGLIDKKLMLARKYTEYVCGFTVSAGLTGRTCGTGLSGGMMFSGCWNGWSS